MHDQIPLVATQLQQPLVSPHIHDNIAIEVVQCTSPRHLAALHTAEAAAVVAWPIHTIPFRIQDPLRGELVIVRAAAWMTQNLTHAVARSLSRIEENNLPIRVSLSRAVVVAH